MHVNSYGTNDARGIRRVWSTIWWWGVFSAVASFGGCMVDFGEDSEEKCGNAVLDPGEECDKDAMNGVSLCRDLGYQGKAVSCRSDCHYDLSECIIPCGNGVIDEGELCDDGNNDTSDSCPSGPNGSCRPASCGDGFVWLGHEQCDDGNRLDGDSCDSDCSLPGCGNGVVEGDEECDEGGVDTKNCDSDCTSPHCGDGHVNQVAGERCDDGNQSNTDACPDGENGSCQPAVCGDGFVWSGHEQCDDGNSANDDDCTTECVLPSCGDGVVNLGEECDGEGMDTDQCDADCSLPLCGDGHINHAVGEQCDDGNDDTSDSCPSGEGGTCQAAFCGDGFLWQDHEQCDDGNTVSGDGCSADCHLESCGNGIVDSGEYCDSNGVDTADCDADCSIPVCGDGHVNAAAHENCDDGNQSNSDACPDGPGGTCEPARCGDGFLWSGHEGCDDGNTDNGDGCNSTCSVEGCGNGVIDAGETCDDGDGDNSDVCPDGQGGTCEPAFCGDGFVWNRDGGAEQCDSGGVDSTQCDYDCTQVECGDGHINQAAGESCDDGNHDNSDACPDGQGGTCEPAFCGDGFVWNRDGGAEQCDSGGVDSTQCDYDCTQVECGDGHINQAAGESCDDGDPFDGDGCDRDCLPEKGWICTGEPSDCFEICGDGLVVGEEECDPPGHTEDSQEGCPGGLERTRECASDCSWGPWGGCHPY